VTRKLNWSDAFALVQSLEVAYVWHATSHLVEVAVGLDRIGFQVRQQIIWNKTAAAMSRQAYHWKHEPCWYAVRRGKTAHWLGSRDQSTIWDAVSPKMIMGGSTEEKLDHPTQKPVELMRRPIMNHTRRGDVVWEPFLGSDTTLAAAESIGRICCGLRLNRDSWIRCDAMGETQAKRRRSTATRGRSRRSRRSESNDRTLPP